jgi:class 3 adenylate cyclase/tetratricopeptide (TPR) repeat protein
MEERKLAAIVFTDIVGYTSRMEADEENTMKLLARQRKIVFPLVEEFGGEVIKEIGDGLLIMFHSALRAVKFAMAVQEKLKDDELSIRAGIHIGDVIFEGGDVFGSAVNIAARIEPLAPEGGICISEDVRNLIRNQHDIITTSIGKKELKGVKDYVEIYCVISKSEKESLTTKPFFKDLWQRRVFQITGLYLLLAYLVRLGMGFIVSKYLLSPHLVNLVWLILLSLIPSIILLSYFHGRKEISKWHKIELIGMPLNIVAALFILIFVFKGKDLGAMTTKVTLLDEEGKSVEKLVMKDEFRKKVLIFNMENVTGDTSLDYLQYGVPIMLNYDLSQDLLIGSKSTLEIYTKIVEAGDEDAVALPVPLMKRYAEQLHMNHFLFGSFDKEDDDYIFNAKLYDTKLTRLLTEFNVRESNPFSIVDRLSREVKKAVGLPESHISSTEDLLVSELFTSSEKALEYYTLAWLENNKNNWGKSLGLYELAVQEDPTFALAYLFVSILKFLSNDNEGALAALEKSMSMDYKLTDRVNFLAKGYYYKIGQEADKVLSVTKMWVELFPDDIMAHSELASLYYFKNQIPEAISEYKEILRLDPEQYDIVAALANIYTNSGEHDSALVYFQQYAEKLPDHTESYQMLGNHYLATGDSDQARINYEKALHLADASERISIEIRLADISLYAGNFNLAHDKYEETLEMSRTAQDSAEVYGALKEFFYLKGQVKKYLEAGDRELDLEKAMLSPVHWMVRKVFRTENYVQAKELDRATTILDGIREEMDPPLGNIVYFGYMEIYAETGEVEEFNDAVSRAYDFINDYGEDILVRFLYLAQGKMNENLEQYQEALEYYFRYLEADPTSYEVHTKIARCYRHLEEYKNAKKEIAISLQHLPFDPSANYEAGLIYLESGDGKKAIEHLERAVEIWKDADEDYDKANLAKEKLESLNSGF